MKSILYVGATLMMGASIYGFVDYKKTIHSREFKSLYKEKESKETATPGATLLDEDKSDILPEEKKEITASELKKEEATKPGISRKKALRATKEKKVKNVNYKLFSRAPLKELPLVPETKKTE